MGKVQSKLVSKRRQSPEGGSLVSNVLTCQSDLERIHKTKLTESLYVELRANRSGSNCNLEVVLPPKKTRHGSKGIHFRVHKQVNKRNSHADVTKCHMVPDEDTQREWVFTLYNFDNSDMVNPEDMTSLMHSMYEVLEASVKPPCGGRTPLKIKLVVTLSADPESILQIATEKEQSALSQDSGNQGRSCYCVDENTERRNHYLDLAGIENYTSKFDNTEPLSHEPSKDNHSAPKHHPVVIRERYVSPGSPRGLSVPPCLKSKAVSVGKDRNGGQGKSCRLHGQLPASSGRPSQPAAHSVLQRSHSKRVRSRVPEAPRSTPGGDKKMFSILQSPRAQRYEHHHHHDHHHHHHHYYHHHHHHPWGNSF